MPYANGTKSSISFLSLSSNNTEFKCIYHTNEDERALLPYHNYSEVWRWYFRSIEIVAHLANAGTKKFKGEERGRGNKTLRCKI